MRRFEEYLAEKLREPEFAEAFWSAELESSIAQQIATLRLLRGISQNKLATLVGTQQSSISRVESGSTMPSLSFLERIAEALDADVEIRLVPRSMN